MKARPTSLLARARAYTQSRAGRSVLTITPLAAIGLTAESARAVTASPVLNPSGTVTYPGDATGADAFGSGTGSIAGSALAAGSNGLTGVKYQGSASFTEFESGRSGLMSTITAFSISGTGNGGTLTSADSSIPLHYNFTLGTTATANDTISVTGWTLTLSITSSSGTGTQAVSNSTGGVGNFNGTTTVTIPGAAAGATLTSYAGSLTVNYTNTGAGSGGTLSVTVPSTSVDFNAVPEPSSWMILSAGVVGAGLYILRTRSQRPQAAPSV